MPGLFVWLQNFLFPAGVFVLGLLAWNASPFLGWNEEVHFLRRFYCLAASLSPLRDPINPVGQSCRLGQGQAGGISGCLWVLGTFSTPA